jgi:hypothetical protein
VSAPDFGCQFTPVAHAFDSNHAVACQP